MCVVPCPLSSLCYVRRSSGFLIALGCMGITAAVVAIALILTEPSEEPSTVDKKPYTVVVQPLSLEHVFLIFVVLLIVGTAVGPWVALVAGRLGALPAAGRVFWRIVLITVLVIVAGTGAAVFVAGEGDRAASLAATSILIAGALALIGAVVLPWTFLTARTLTRERAARARAEERAAVAAHLHDSVLQSLILIQKRADDIEVRRLARGTERELRAWLYGQAQPAGDDLAAAVRASAEEAEDRFGVLVELVTVGTCPLDERSRAVVGAVREAMTNAAKHAGVRRVSVFVEVADGEVLALVRDKGCGFDPSVHSGSDRRGIADSIEGRLRQYGGTSAIRSTAGDGTEVELHMPLVGAQ